MKSFNFKSATNTKEAAKLVSGRSTFLGGGMTLLHAIKLSLKHPILNKDMHFEAPLPNSFIKVLLPIPFGPLKIIADAMLFDIDTVKISRIKP